MLFGKSRWPRRGQHPITGLAHPVLCSKTVPRCVCNMGIVDRVRHGYDSSGPTNSPRWPLPSQGACCV